MSKNIIPPVTDPMGRTWVQPCAKNITLTNHTAKMDKAAFTLLAEYSHSIPSGVYEGKMFKRRTGEGWVLVWFSQSMQAGLMDLNYRKIIVVNQEVPDAC